MASAICGLCDDELVLVHIADSLVGACDLWYVSEELACVPFVDLAHIAALPYTCWSIIELSIELMRVCCV